MGTNPQNDDQNDQKTPQVNETCIGCGACVAISPEVFELDGEGKSIVKPLDDYEGNSIDDSINACPVSAISYE